MSTVEIPLLRESRAFAARLVEAASRFDESRYRNHRRVNWSYRFDAEFYVREAQHFRDDAEGYLAQRVAAPQPLADVFARRLRARTVATWAAKVAAHWLFRSLGGLAEWLQQASAHHADAARVYRKAYVDDIELVFDPDEAQVLRAVYPFPINAARQWRYLRTLRREGRRFRLAGHAYLASDVWRFLVRRDVYSLCRMEARAQVRHAREVAARGFDCVQLSDEFDIGSLDFARTLARAGNIRVVNSAHGVGKYLPMHAYPEFHVLTRRQAEYYHATRACRYPMRRLNSRAVLALPVPAAMPGSEPPSREGTTAAGVSLVFLSQVFVGVSPLVAEAEARVVAHLADAFAAAAAAGDAGVQLFYRPHPNNHRPAPPRGFAFIGSLDAVNGKAGTVFASLFSTCQVDPAFAGHKVLLREVLIHPAIAFDDDEIVLDAAGLVGFMRALPQRLLAGNAGAPPREQAAGFGTARVAPAALARQASEAAP